MILDGYFFFPTLRKVRGVCVCVCLCRLMAVRQWPTTLLYPQLLSEVLQAEAQRYGTKQLYSLALVGQRPFSNNISLLTANSGCIAQLLMKRSLMALNVT